MAKLAFCENRWSRKRVEMFSRFLSRADVNDVGSAFDVSNEIVEVSSLLDESNRHYESRRTKQTSLFLLAVYNDALIFRRRDRFGEEKRRGNHRLQGRTVCRRKRKPPSHVGVGRCNGDTSTKNAVRLTLFSSVDDSHLYRLD